MDTYDPVDPVEADEGLFGPDSVTWRVHVEPIMWVAGFRALLLQSLHPRVMRGTYQNSALFDRSKAWDRFLRTTEFVTVRTFGRRPDVELAASRVRRIHAGLTGWDPDRSERFRLDEAEGLLWVHCAEIASYVDIASRAGIVDAAAADVYVDEGRRSAALVGLPESAVPGSRAELEAYFSSIRPRLYATEEARAALLNSLNPPIPFPYAGLRLLGLPMSSLAFATLPRWARRMFGVPIALPTTDLAVTAMLRGLRGASRPLRRPPPLEFARRA